MSLETRFQLDHRPSLDVVSTLYIETSIMGLIRIVACEGYYESDDNEKCQGIDLSINEANYFAREIENASNSQEFTPQLVPEFQIHDGIHIIEMASGYENYIKLTISYANDPDLDKNNSVCIYISRIECIAIAHALRAAAIIRDIGDKEVAKNNDAGLIN